MRNEMDIIIKANYGVISGDETTCTHIPVPPMYIVVCSPVYQSNNT